MATFYVFVAGASGSGKSQLLLSLGEPDKWWQEEEKGLEFRHVIVDDTLDVILFCSVDASRFDQLLEIEQHDLLGYIVMMDSTDPDSWEAGRTMIDNCRGYALMPMMIAANKQDLPGAYSPEEVGEWVGLASMMQVYPCVATDPESALALFLQLLYSVQNEYDRLDALIAEIERLNAEAGESQPDA